ncbi:trypsin-like peptidase domain-containing protein [Bifidobacterium pullorum subsp. saeculare]|uniref:Trypsin-like peptidase domain-containing protein n=1 Tax=Bifidobacterium pullorum subsp. saeculare TaxID=78257 RepID=A0A938WWP9_9BIFI|nr:trypsin-like peptidase domain-containing protein [Bifidobacterium pullorum]MBM6700285.1 trypsin-like peptidase domain-containing protein [Bifidobacterium pullorum subsp. saeculare]
MAENNTTWRPEDGAADGQPQGEPAAAPETNAVAPAGQTPADDTPDYAAAKGEQTVVSSAPAEQTPDLSAADTARTADDPVYAQGSPYRPAPEYGAYGPGYAPGPQNGPQNGPFSPGNPFAGRGPQNPGGPQFPPQGPAAPGNPFGPQNPGGQNGPASAAARKPMGQTVKMVVVAIVAAVVAVALSLSVGFAALTNGWVTIPGGNSLTNVQSNKSGSGSATAKTGEAPDWQTVAADVSDSVVSITTVVQNGSAKGSGAIIDGGKGTIVTNNHVIDGAQQIQVTLSNGQMYSAQVVGTDTTTDLAVIRLDNPPSGLKAVEFADSDKLAVGEPIMAVGNPLGYDDTVTAGIVSALNRPVSVMDEDSGEQIVTNAVQIDAAVNPGNSGGPSFNAAGQVIGINSSIATASGSSSSAGSIGIGFAIPSNLVKRVADEIVKDGKVQHVALGVTIKTAAVEADGVARAGAQVVTPSTGGSAVVSGSPADKAGLKVNDVIVAYNGNAVNSMQSLLGFVRATAMGQTVKLTIVRDGKTMDVDVTLDQAEADVNGTTRREQQGGGSSGQNGQGGNGYDGQGGNGYDGGGLFDPFGLW